MSLIEFILEKKISGYASGGEGQERSFDDGSRGFEFIGSAYRYLDRYYGFNPFTGTEHIYATDGTLIWVMNYYGEILSTNIDPMKIYGFLKEAMRLVTPEYPFRGPATFKRDSLRYENKQFGTLDRFHGTENIFDGDENVYYLHYHGGKIVKT